MFRSPLKSVPRPFRPGIEVARRGMLGLPAVGAVDFGDLRRTAPISRKFGVDRGLPVDRFYIERFLAKEADSIRGQVLEVGEDTYTRRFGGQRVTGNDVLHVTGDNPAATIVADLADAPQVPDERFDSIVLTQTLQLIFDPPASAANAAPHPEARWSIAGHRARHFAGRHAQRLGSRVVLVVYRGEPAPPACGNVRGSPLPVRNSRQRAGGRRVPGGTCGRGPRTG